MSDWVSIGEAADKVMSDIKDVQKYFVLDSYQFLGDLRLTLIQEDYLSDDGEPINKEHHNCIVVSSNIVQVASGGPVTGYFVRPTIVNGALYFEEVVENNEG